MKLQHLFLAFFFLALVACGGDDGVSVEIYHSNDSFSCNVNVSNNSVMQTIYGPDVEGQSGIIYRDTVALFYLKENFKNKSSQEVQDVCDSLKVFFGDLLDDGSYSCKSKSVTFEVPFPISEVDPLVSVRADMESECSEYKNEWRNSQKSSSSSAKSSSSVRSSSSLSSSSSAKSSSSVRENFEMDPVLSSSSKDGASSSSGEGHYTGFFMFDGASAADYAVVEDEKTDFYEDFGGMGLSLDFTFYSTNYSMDKDMPQGSLEFFFRPHEEFFAGYWALVGNDGARLLVYYDFGKLVLMMNKTNEFRYLSVDAEIKNDWNFVCAQWDGERAYLFLNNEEIGRKTLEGGYAASDRSNEHDLFIGHKSSCCMSGAGMTDELYSAADFGPVRVSSEMRIPVDDVDDE